MQRAATDLSDVWQEVKEEWSDENSRKFEEDYLRALAPLLRKTQAAITSFAEVMANAEADCVDPDRPDMEL